MFAIIVPVVDRVWRRLVARLNGVQEAAGSIPVTRILKKALALTSRCFFCFQTGTPAHFSKPHIAHYQILIFSKVSQY